MSKYRCIFCQSAQKLSREHVWADWLRNYLQRPNKRAFHFVSSSKTGGQITRGKLNRPGDLHAQRLQVVCKSCNETWMGKLQEAAKPIIVPLLNDNWDYLGEREQRILAAWAIMFTMVNEFSHPESVAAPQRHRDQFRNTSTIPPDWSVWLGRARFDLGHTGTANHHGAAFVPIEPKGLPKVHYFQSTGFTVGNLFFLTVMLTPPTACCVLQKEVAEQDGLFSIWPYEADYAGAPGVLNFDDFTRVTNQFITVLGGNPFTIVPKR